MKRRMRRKVLAILTTVAMVLSLAPSALAGPFSDVPDNHQYAGAINRLAELGVLEGVGGGRYDPEGTYTRAQFAALVTKMMGLKSAADASKGATDFRDVPADHWASGYVNVASSMGIVKGYGDGTFKPDKLVNHAEALTMLVRALGYEPVLKGKWPANVLVKAAELGLTSGVTVVANLPASRGEVAQFSNNAVDVPMMIQTGYGDQVKYVVSGTENTDRKTLLSSSTTGKVIDGQLVETGAVVGSSLADDEVKIHVTKENGKAISSEIRTYKLGAGVTAAVADMLGEDVKATVREIGGDNVIVGLTSTNGSKFVVKRVHAATTGNDANHLTDDTITLGSSTDNKTYGFASGARVWYQGATLTSLADNTGTLLIATGDNVRAKVLLDSSNQVTVAVILDYDPANLKARIVSSVNTTNKSVAWFYPASTTTGVRDVDLTIVRNGKIVGLGDLQKGDVVYNLTASWPSNGASGNFVWIAVNKGTVTGNLGGISSDLSTVSIGGNNVDGVGTSMASSKDDGKTFGTNLTAAQELLGQSVTGYLDAIGRVLAMVSSAGTAAAANEKYGLIYEIKTATSGLDTKTYIRLWNSSGSKQDLVVTKDTKLYANASTGNYTVYNDSELQDAVDDSAVAIDTGAERVADALGYSPATNSGVSVPFSRDATGNDGYRLVKYTLTSTGELDTVRDMDRGTGLQNDIPLGFNKDTNRVSGDGTTGVASSSTIVFQTAETTPEPATGDIKMGTWDGIKKTTSPKGRYVVDSDGKVLVIVLTYDTSGLAAATTTGIMTAAPMLTGTDTYTIYVDEAGTAKTYSAKTSDWTVKNAAGGSVTGGITDSNVKKGAVVVVEPKAGGGYTLTLKEVNPRDAVDTPGNNDGVVSVGTDNVKVTGLYYDNNNPSGVPRNGWLYWTAAGVNVYDTRGGQVRKVNLSDLQTNDKVFMQFNADGDVELIKIK